MNPFSKAFLEEVTKLAEPPPPKGWSLKAWDKHLQGKEKDSSVDDLESPPGTSYNPRIAQAWGLKKGSSWMDIGPDNSPDRPWRPPGRVKSASAGFVDEMRKLSYKLQGHTEVGGLRIAIENRKGSVRSGKSRDGHEWRTKMKNPYGYIVGTEGKDGDAVDAYVGPDKEAPKAFVVHQHKPDGTGYDEDKVMLGFLSKAEATKAYLKHYDSKKFLGPISIVTMDRLRELVASKRKLVKISAVSEPERRSRLVRGAGPGMGGLIGAGIGAALGAKKGKLLKGAITGLGTGATLGWTPAMAHDAIKAIKKYRSGNMKLITMACLLISSVAQATGPCTTQDYSNAAKEPRYDCPGPGEGALVPDVQTRASKGLIRGTTIIPTDQKSKPYSIDYDGVLMGKMKVVELGMKIKGLRRLRWADTHKGAEALAIEKKFISATWTVKVQLRDSQLVQAKKQITQARKERDEARKWYRSWTFGLVVGVVATSAAVIGTAVAIR